MTHSLSGLESRGSQLQTPQSPYMSQNYQLSYEEAIRQISILSNELREYESSSKELEDAMEQELVELQKEKSERETQLLKKEDELKKLRSKMITIEKELNSVMGKNNESVVFLEQKISTLTKSLRDVEIQNEQFQYNERVVNSKYQDLEIKYNELIENNVLIQDELNEVTQSYHSEKLQNSNNIILIRDLKDKILQMEIENERLKVRISKPEKLSKYQTPLITAVDEPIKISPISNENNVQDKPEFSRSKSFKKSLPKYHTIGKENDDPFKIDNSPPEQIQRKLSKGSKFLHAFRKLSN